MAIRVEPAEPLPEVYSRYARTLQQAFGPQACLTISPDVGHRHDARYALAALAVLITTATLVACFIK